MPTFRVWFDVKGEAYIDIDNVNTIQEAMVEADKADGEDCHEIGDREWTLNRDVTMDENQEAIEKSKNMIRNSDEGIDENYCEGYPEEG